MNDFEKTIEEVRTLLQENKEWEDRYADYVATLLPNVEIIREKKKGSFHQWAPLYLYANVTKAKGDMSFDLRFLGQSVATIKAKNGDVRISTKGYKQKNLDHFGCKISLDNENWRSDNARRFRQHFKSVGSRNTNSAKKNDEHRIESLFLSELSKKRSENKLLLNIQPVRLADLRFQMATPLGASKNLEYSGSHGGGIDILARVGNGWGAKLCIIELKYEVTSKELPAKAIQQAIAYATFIRELLRSKSGQQWYQIFGFGSKLPQKLKFFVACAIPDSPGNDKSFVGQKLKIGDDIFELQYIYFKENNNRLVDMTTSVPGVKRNPNL
jgi:hypothetical protein